MKHTWFEVSVKTVKGKSETDIHYTTCYEEWQCISHFDAEERVRRLCAVFSYSLMCIYKWRIGGRTHRYINLEIMLF